MKILLLLLLLISCSSILLTESPIQGKTTYSYSDVGGTLQLNREKKIIQKKIVTRNQLIDTKDGRNKVLEKTILVSRIGSIKTKKSRILIVRPQASEFTIWLEGQRYTSRMELNPKTQSMKIGLASPEQKWQGDLDIKFPKGKYFCFYGQIPECLYHNSLLIQANAHRRNKYNFHIIWEGYPFIQDLLTNVGRNLFAVATLKFDGEINGQFRYSVEVEGQMILYHFTKSFDLIKVAWIAQGITIVPPGEEIADDD